MKQKVIIKTDIWKEGSDTAFIPDNMTKALILLENLVGLSFHVDGDGVIFLHNGHIVPVNKNLRRCHGTFSFLLLEWEF